MPGSEPRLHIRNLASSLYLTLDDHWTPGTRDMTNRHELFKVEWKEKVGDMATLVMIRTDKHPQKLLDAGTMKFEGNACDGKKKHKPERWWKLNYLNVTESEVTVLIQSHSGKYLAEISPREGVELISIDGNTRTDENTPTRAKWGLTIGGSGFSPGQVATLCLMPLAVALGAVTGGAGFVTALETASAITLDAVAAVPASIATEAALDLTVESVAEEMVVVSGESVAEGTEIPTSAATAERAHPGSKLKAIVVAGVITGALTVEASGALRDLLADVSNKMFVQG